MSVGAAAAPAAAETAIYVSTHGRDTWSGRLAEPNAGETDGPFATLERARDEVRRIKAANDRAPGPITVYVREGRYFRDRTFELKHADSGTSEAPVTYRALGSEAVRLIGGKAITHFSPAAPGMEQRLDAAARGHVMQCDLRAEGITDFGRMSARGFGRPVQPAGLELFFNGRPMTLARWPNRSWTKIAGVPAGDGGRFTYEGDRPARWATAPDGWAHGGTVVARRFSPAATTPDAWVHGFWTWDWADSFEKIRAINLQKREITTEPPHGVYGYKAGKRFYVLNLLEELDEPGEWYLDRQSGILYFWPPSPIESGEALVSTLDALVTLDGVSYVTLQGLSLEATRGTAIVISGGAHDRLAGCNIANNGNLAVDVRGGADHQVIACDIANTGDGGISLAGGDRNQLTPAGHCAINNHIRDFSRWVITYRPAVSISGVGQRVAHNLIHDAPHTAIALAGNEHVIEFNEVHTVCMDTDDAGAFYMGRDWTQRGNVVRYNCFHDLGRFRGGVGVMAVYLDDWTSGTKVYGNLCYRAGRAVLIGGGRDNLVENNIFVDCTPAVHVDARGLGWAKSYFDGRDKTLVERLRAVPYRQPPWSTKYPELLTLYDDQPAVPKGNVICRNVCSGGRWLDLLDGLTEKGVLQVHDNLVTSDPGFVDRAAGKYQLKEDSPAYQAGFERIPIEQMGLYRDEYRTALPATRPAVR